MKEAFHQKETVNRKGKTAYDPIEVLSTKEYSTRVVNNHCDQCKQFQMHGI